MRVVHNFHSPLTLGPLLTNFSPHGTRSHFQSSFAGLRQYKIVGGKKVGDRDLIIPSSESCGVSPVKKSRILVNFKKQFVWDTISRRQIVWGKSGSKI